MKSRTKQLIILLLLLAAALVCLYFLVLRGDGAEKDHPTSVNTRSMAREELILTPASDPAEPNPVDRGFLAVRPLELRSEWTASLSLLIVDSVSQRPIPGVKVYLQGPIRLPSAWSDADGNVSFLQLPMGDYYSSLVHDAYATDLMRHSDSITLKAGEHKEVLVEMSPACIATGRILDARNGKAISGVSIFPNRYEENEAISSDSDGRFEVVTGELKKADLYIRMAGYAPQELLAGCVDGQVDLGDVVLTASWILTGKVIDENGDPLAGVVVQDYPRSRESVPPANSIRTTTDRSGRFRMTGLPTTDEWIFFYREGYASTDAIVNPTTPRDFEVRMFTSCLLVGKVIDSNEAPIDGVTVMAIRSGWGQNSSSVTRNDGNFRLSLHPGYVELWAIHQTTGGQLRKYVTAHCSEEMEPISIVFETDTGVKATGKVLASDGRPVADALVVARSKHNTADLPMRHTSTDESGDFELEVSAEGRYSLNAFSMKLSQNGKLKDLEGDQSGLEIRLKAFSMTGHAPKGGTVEDVRGETIIDYSYCWSSCRRKLDPDIEGRWTRSDRFPIDFPPLWVILKDGSIGRLDSRQFASDDPSVLRVGKGAALFGRLGQGFPDGLTTVQIGTPRVLTKLLIDSEFRFPLLPPGHYKLMLTASDGRRLDIDRIVIRDAEDVDLGELDFSGGE